MPQPGILVPDFAVGQAFVHRVPLSWNTMTSPFHPAGNTFFKLPTQGLGSTYVTQSGQQKTVARDVH